MPAPASVSAFPWASLERVPRGAVRAWGMLNRSLASHAGLLAQPLAHAAASWLHAPVRFEWCALTSSDVDASVEPSLFYARVDPGPIGVSLQLDWRLITLLVDVALKRPSILYDPRLSPDDALVGAAAAIILKLIEDARLGIAVQFVAAPLDIPHAQRVQLEALMHVGGVAYRVRIGLAMNPLCANPSSGASMNFALLSRLPLDLPLVIGTSLVNRDVLAQLAPGKGFLPGAGLWVDQHRVGRAVLVAPRSDCGMGVRLEPDGKIVLRELKATLNPDELTSTVAPAPELPSVPQAVLDAPVVLRIELAAVSLPAQQWAGLRTGDIIETGKPLGTEVTLRVAGQALATGELLNIDGELGVRITKLLAEEA